MTIVWGEWNNWGSTNGGAIRVGVDVTPSTVTNGSTTFTATVDVYTQNERAFTTPDGQQLNYYDDWSGTKNYTNAEGTSPVLRDTKVYTHTYSTYGTSPGAVDLCVEIHDGPIPYNCTRVTIPARPYALPAVPSGVTLTRNSDAQATLTWTRNSTASAFYSNQTIQMRRWDGATPWTEASWTNLAAVAGTATSYVKSGLEANHAYQFRIRAENSTGPSAWVESNVIFMTPAAPSGVASVMNSTGTAITTTWTDNAFNYTPTAPLSWKIQRSVNGAAYADLDTVATQATVSYTDNTADTTKTNAYRIAAVVGALQSAYGTGATVSAVTPPLAPTLLSPNGVYVDLVNDGAVLTWQYNPGGTGTSQTHYTVEYSDDGGATWDVLPGANDVASSVSSFTLPAGILSNNVLYRWRVRTEGIVAAGYGPNSASATLTGSTKPTVTLTLPVNPTNTFKITAQWVYAQAELWEQTNYEALLLAADGTTLLEKLDGFDAATAVTFQHVATTGANYVVKVRALSEKGIWSSYATSSFLYSLLPPANVVSTGEYQLCRGTVLLHFEPTASVPGTTVDIESITVERRTPGTDWVTLAEGLLIPTDFLDTLPLTHGTNEYRITAVSATPSRAVMPLLEVVGTDGDNAGDPLWAWVSYGDNFETTLRVHGDLQINEVTGRLKTTQHFLGRAKPIALVGQATTRAVTVAGALNYDARCPAAEDLCRFDSVPQEWGLAGQLAEVVCYRDFTGRRLFGTLADVPLTEVLWPGHASVGFTVTEVDFTERYVQLVVA